MSEQRIEDFIGETLTGDALKNAAELFSYLSENEMQFERGKGYWADKLYWMVKYKGESVCYILINDSENIKPWIVWSDDSDTDWYAEAALEERKKEIAWENVDICGNCGGCGKPGGRHKMVFGKGFDNVCLATMSFDNPNAETVECIKDLVELRMKDILSKAEKSEGIQHD